MRGLIDTDNAARRLGLKPATLAQWRWRGCGPPFRKLGGAVRYSLDDLDDFIDTQLRHSTSDRGEAA